MKRYVRPRKDPGKTTLLILIAVPMMILTDMFVFGNYELYMRHRGPVNITSLPVVQSVQPARESSGLEPSAAHTLPLIYGPDLAQQRAPQTEIYGPPIPGIHAHEQGLIKHDRESALEYEEALLPGEEASLNDLREDMPLAAPHEGPYEIAIVIDDLGPDRIRSRDVLALSGPLTVAILPYARGAKDFAKEAKLRGHETLIHAPMEAMNSKTDPGPIALLSGMDPSEIDNALEQMLESFDGYVGINNHMGSRLTQDQAAMRAVMKKLATRGLIFLDSKTINTSVAAQVGRQYGLRVAERDVFLDHEHAPDFVRRALSLTESIARRKGYAVAIGHPKEHTIAVLEEWIPTLEARGFVLVPVSKIVRSSARSAALLEDSDVPQHYGPFRPAAAKNGFSDEISSESLLDFSGPEGE